MYRVLRRGELYTGFWRGNLRQRGHLEDRGVDGRIILRRIYGKGVWVYGLDRAGSGYAQVAGTFECGNEGAHHIPHVSGLRFNIAPTCFGSQRIHHQAALYSAWLKLQKWFYRVRWHGGSRCYGSTIWLLSLVLYLDGDIYCVLYFVSDVFWILLTKFCSIKAWRIYQSVTWPSTVAS